MRMKKSIFIIAFILSFIMLHPVHANEKNEELNYVYINESEQQEGATQNIAVSWGDGSQKIKSAELGVKNEKGDTIVVSGNIYENGIILFQNAFEKGAFDIDYLLIKTENDEKNILLKEAGIYASFSVGVECDNFEKSNCEKMESLISEQQDEESSVIKINVDNVDYAEDIVSQGLVDTPVVQSRKIRSATDNIVVVLDPGHDSTHTGASGNGVTEHKATMKIAKYCKAELEKYDNVTVYLTRTTESCPYPGSTDNLDDIEQRVKWADKKGADVFVSIHLNAAPAAAAKGAEVFYSASSSSGKTIAQKVQDELTALGLYDRGVKVNDNYTVIKTSKKCGFPGIIIEHGFMTNSNDALKYLKTDAGLEKLGKADATGIAEYFGLQKAGTKVSMAEAVYTISNLATENKVLSVVSEKADNESVEDELDETPEEAPQETVSIEMKKHEKLATQRFEVVSAGNKYYYLVVEESGKVIGITDGTVKEETLEKSKTQKWAFIAAGNDRYYLQSQSGKYLAVSDVKVTVQSKKSSQSQRWVFTRATYRSVKNLTPELVSAKNSNGTVVVKWKYLTGASGYYVYRKKSGDSSWKNIATVKSGATTTYTDNSVKSNTKYIYTIRAYKGETKSLYNKKGLSITTPKNYIKYSTTTSVNYRKGPGVSYSKVGKLTKGKAIYVEEGYSKKAGSYTWYRFKLNTDSSKTYYIAAKYLVKGTLVTYETYKTTSKLNYRSGAGTSYAVKGTLAKGVNVSVVKGWSKTANGYKWYKIKRNGKYYYVAAKYLKKL